MESKVKLGADPEFLVYDSNGQFKCAADVIEGRYSERVGCDGVCSTGELRPNPGRWDEVFKDIQRIIKKELPKELKGRFKVFAGSGRGCNPTGGHIHFSGLGNRPSPILLANLDKWIYKSLNSISDTSYRSEYNRPRQYRSQPHGFEYRSPLSWISTPILTKGVLCLSYVLVRQEKRISSAKKLLKVAYKAERKVLEDFFNEIERIKLSNTNLEQIELFQAWGKKIVAKREKMTKITWKTDGDFMSTIFSKGLAKKCYLPLDFEGAGLYRTSDLVIYFPTNFKFRNSDLLKDITAGIRTWDHSLIGLSYNLRKDIKLCRKQIRFLIRNINKLERAERNV